MDCIIKKSLKEHEKNLKWYELDFLTYFRTSFRIVSYTESLIYAIFMIYFT